MGDYQTDYVYEAKAIIDAMRKSQPGVHVDLLERGFAVAFNAWADAQFDKVILASPRLTDEEKLVLLNKDRRTPHTWAGLFGVRVNDPSWENFDSVPVERHEFFNRLSQSDITELEDWSPLRG